MIDKIFTIIVSSGFLGSYIGLITRTETVQTLEDRIKTLELLRVTCDYLKYSQDKIEDRDKYYNLCQKAIKELINKD